jgi:uncharacterized SAM-binding protein YcdF (DUF218 family)
MLLGLVGLIREWSLSARNRRPWVLSFSFVGILLLSSGPLASLASRPLQTSYENVPMPRESADGIVVLSGSFDAPSPDRPYPLVGEDTYRRLLHAIWLYKFWFQRPILVCGGGDSRTFPETVRRILETEGIPSDSIWIEERSRSTRENAFNCSPILRARGISKIALVVNAGSMLRAAASFKKLGMSVVPAPFDFEDSQMGLYAFIPTWKAIRSNAETLHELAGYAWYWLKGWV